MSLTADKARAVADLNDGTIVATVEIQAPPERVFRALTSDEITRWWGSPETYQTTEWSGDVRPGGRWRAAGIGADGTRFNVAGEFIEVVPAKKIVQTWRADWDAGNVTTITIRLEPIEGGTRLTLWHTGFAGRPGACAGHRHGWERVLEWLARHVGASLRPPARYFLCRLLPPRPTFAQDMSAQEAEIMKKHSAYWMGLLQRDTAIVFGPVGDPRGAWGLGVVRAAGEAEVDALRDADPAILSGRGFRYEILPMLQAVVRE
jgi:uncharacterized protein YndB with AHSA1/START domain